ncbi:Lnb N-terminal periplasmic domain-containing protein [Ectopseudomonas mendocina]|uniref:Lnb N-terminal periplasmic domain-containing protein n=1 Tax=Ectopseudomonas mendocina TaxID=300 RepID=UPI003F03621A
MTRRTATLKRIFAVLALSFSLPLHADTAETLATDPYWIALGHYETGKLGGWRSYVDDGDFFLAENGASDPAAELQATLKALYQPAELGDRHPQCIYPARTRWLKAQLQLDDLPSPDCAEYRNWFADVNPHSTVLVFPAAYLNSPSSMFGHTLLRIDQPDIDSHNTALLSYALNFGAFIEGNDNSILYAWRGLMGGYPGLFALVPYREKLSEYNRLENRDLWEYRLNLTPEETARMVEHVWELKQIRFDYFFFDENCSYRLLELLEIARPGIELTEHFPLTAIPTDTVRAVKDAGLVERIDYRPSRERELLARAEPLESEEQNWALRLSEDPAQLESADFLAISKERRALIQDAAFRLVRYHANDEERSSNAQRSFQLLGAINRNPPPPLEVERPPLPEEGHESRTWQLAGGSRDDRAFAEYGLRMAYHDLNDNLDGFPLGAQIEIFQLKLRKYENNHWQLQRLDLANIRSLTPRNALLQPLSWQVGGGLERVLGEDGDSRLVGHISGGAGATWELYRDLLGFALGTTRLEYNEDFAAVISPALGFNAGLLWRNPLGNLTLEAASDYFHNGEVRQRLSLNQQWEVSRNLGLRLSAQREFSQLASPVNEVKLELRWYHY